MKYPKERYLIRKNFCVDLLNDLADNKCYLAGGAIRSIFTRTEVNDFDIYMKKNNIFELINVLKKYNFESYRATDTALSFLNEDGMKIQIITHSKLIGKPDEIFKYFDFNVCMGAYDFEKDEFILEDSFILANSTKEVEININTMYPISTLMRTYKYSEYGYRFKGQQIFKLAMKISSLEFKTYKDVKEHLMGIDVSILRPFIDKLEESEFGKKKFELNEFLEEMDEFFDDFYEDIVDSSF